MQRCLQLALNGIGNVAPNPMVGCVIVHNNTIIGEGYHQQYGGKHAEVCAIDNVNDKSLLSESTLYVNLEPCNHFGKTPPCADLILDHKIKTVVTGIKDPFSKVNGGGIKKLKDAGIEVIENILENECKQLNRRFLTFTILKRPYIILKWAQSADGFIAPLQQNENNRWISNAYSQKLVHKWRSEEAAILIGANTALKDNPRLSTRLWQGKNPIRVLIDKNLKTPVEHFIFTEAGNTIVICNEESKEKTIEYCKVDFNKNVLKQLIEVLHKRNIQSIIIEGGFKTLTQFINEGLWDEARVFIATEKNLGKGIPAPKISTEPALIEKVINDNLLTYLNINI